MLSFLPGLVKGVLCLLLYFLNTVLCFVPILLIATVKLALPIEKFQHACALALKKLAGVWVRINIFSTSLFNRVTWDISGLEGLEMDHWYLVVSNHQSWSDILILQKIFYKKIPFLKFFLKKELIWVPFLGFAWWALDFPFMKRYSQAFLKKNPHLAGKDLETTQKACAKFAKDPVSVMNFLEGTRFTEQKHQAQQSPYKHLLRPKAGGVAFVLAAMGGILDKMVNVTIAYPHGKKSFWDYMCGRVDLVRVRIQTIDAGKWFSGDYFADASFREDFQEWLNSLWREKDALLDQMVS